MSTPNYRFTCFEFETPCSYFPEKKSQIRLCDPAQSTPESYDILIQNGYRRDGTAQYCPVCADCQACKSTRVRTNEFIPNATQRKTLKRNSHLLVRSLPPVFVQEHYDLFIRYERMRHGGHMSTMTEQDYTNHLLGTSARTFLLEFSYPDTQAPAAVAVVDDTADGLSAVYTFYDPQARTSSLGTFCILYELELAKRLGYPYLYLGYWLQNYPRMDYKRNFQPTEVFHNSRWLDFDAFLQETT
jgi:arginine-tRNA-protein transferase